MLQTVCMSPELLVNQNISENEVCGYSPGQGSPLPGETASPKSFLQQSPSLPDSGLTELSVASPRMYPPPSRKPQEMPAPTGKIKSLFTFSILCNTIMLLSQNSELLWLALTPFVLAESCANSSTSQVSVVTALSSRLTLPLVAVSTLLWSAAEGRGYCFVKGDQYSVISVYL